jgi:hypothetical protein
VFNFERVILAYLFSLPGVNRLTGLPNGNPLALAPSDNIETHGPYQHGAGWPAVNGDYNNLDLFNPNTPAQEYPSSPIGLGQPNQFTSEFGSATWSSFERYEEGIGNCNNLRNLFTPNTRS